MRPCPRQCPCDRPRPPVAFPVALSEPYPNPFLRLSVENPSFACFQQSLVENGRVYGLGLGVGVYGWAWAWGNTVGGAVGYEGSVSQACIDHPRPSPIWLTPQLAAGLIEKQANEGKSKDRAGSGFGPGSDNPRGNHTALVAPPRQA